MSADEAVEEKSRRRRRRRRKDDDSEERGVSQSKGRATPGRRSQGGEDGGNFITNIFYDLNEYRVGVRDELRKVTWPTREEIVRLTWIVLSVTVASALVLGLISFVFTELFIIGLETPIVFALVFVVVLVGYFAYTRYAARSGNAPYR